MLELLAALWGDLTAPWRVQNTTRQVDVNINVTSSVVDEDDCAAIGHMIRDGLVYRLGDDEPN